MSIQLQGCARACQRTEDYGAYSGVRWLVLMMIVVKLVVVVVIVIVVIVADFHVDLVVILAIFRETCQLHHQPQVSVTTFSLVH